MEHYITPILIAVISSCIIYAIQSAVKRIRSLEYNYNQLQQKVNTKLNEEQVWKIVETKHEPLYEYMVRIERKLDDLIMSLTRKD